MKVVYSEAHRLHDGAKELLYGEMVPLFEMPRRMDMVLAALKAKGFNEHLEPERFALEPLARVHAPDYLAFLEGAYAQWKKEGNRTDFALPFTFALRRLQQAPGASIQQRLGWYTFDLSAPFVEGTWQAIKTSADVALTAQKLIAGGARAAFALCRPPGHHAMRDMAGGYCYVNNAAVAAQAFIDGGAGRAAILDIDYHHGNGTQDIFYERDDVLFVSLHGHPDQEYPYFAGYAEERGRGKGEGLNINYPLPWGTSWREYRPALEDAIAKVKAFGPDALVVSLGVDTFEKDPISRFKLKSPDYLEMGALIGAMRLPSLIVMEGGYAVEEIGINAVNVLLGFEGAA